MVIAQIKCEINKLYIHFSQKKLDTFNEVVEFVYTWIFVS